MKVVDLIHEAQPELWDQCVRTIAASDDPLRDNYLNINFNEFISFPVVIDHGQIICFSGLQYNERKWGQGIARISSRMWIHPEYRHHGLTKFAGGTKFLNTTHCLPVQFKAALSNNIDVVFISRSDNPLAFKQYLKLVEINCNYKFDLMPSMYNVCGPQKIVPESCCQYVATCPLNSQGMPTWMANMSSYSLVSI